MTNQKHLFMEDGTGTLTDYRIDEKVSACVDELIDTMGSEYNLAELEAYVMELILARFCWARITNRSESKKDTDTDE